jgi:hypothetical protein
VKIGDPFLITKICINGKKLKKKSDFAWFSSKSWERSHKERTKNWRKKKIHLVARNKETCLTFEKDSFKTAEMLIIKPNNKRSLGLSKKEKFGPSVLLWPNILSHSGLVFNYILANLLYFVFLIQFIWKN